MTPAALVADLLSVLRADAPLLGQLGGASVFDRPPRDGPWPRVVLATVDTADWSTASEPGTEHRVTFHAWTRGPGRAGAADLSEAVRQALIPVSGPRPGGLIVGVEHVDTRIAQRSPETWLASIRFRISAEPL